jgi:hypothetical protein
MIVYVLALYVAEAAWCYVGLRRLREPVESLSGLRALTYGLVRLLIGRTMVFVTQNFLTGVSDWVIYGVVLLPLRWLAWSFVAELIAVGRVRFGTLLAGDRRSNLWRLGGTLLCCAADLIVLFGGYWVGLFWP